ncbi:MAG: hypothetical protein J7L55_06015 [Desulfurococcales archaeon]|nr:hypothetical protein [Desulfurococcales archaeon]
MAFGMIFDPYEFVALMSGLIALIGLSVYVVFYELFQEAAGRKVAEEGTPIRYYPVMGGWDADISETPAIGRLVVDILQRAWKNASKVLSRGAKAYMRDWYVYAYIVLLALVVAALMVR